MPLVRAETKDLYTVQDRTALTTVRLRAAIETVTGPLPSGTRIAVQLHFKAEDAALADALAGSGAKWNDLPEHLSRACSGIDADSSFQVHVKLWPDLPDGLAYTSSNHAHQRTIYGRQYRAECHDLAGGTWAIYDYQSSRIDPAAGGPMLTRDEAIARLVALEASRI